MQPLDLWPLSARRGVVGVFTDIDDTLTSEGAITPDALQALADLKAAGLYVIPVTGRPIGWCEPFMAGPSGTTWPVDAMVAENGAVAFVRGSGSQPPLVKLYQQDVPTRSTNQARMRVIAAQVAAEVPGVALSRDSAGRETDLAFDYAEFDRHSTATVRKVLSVLQHAGMQTTVSSIHIHGCFGDFNKWQGANWIVRQLLGRELAKEQDRWVFVGDSGNDQAMFEHFTHSVGVANIERFVPQLTHLPRYIARGERGAGFAEVAHALLAARTAGEAER
ncbi:HAD-IIB family hydrolase [Acidovorax sp. RAC01]|uniref:HAD-IIB family hydrolase n=1 Tax=Acidovorax sp. RAC01 TaxID=1842533 RepID=UPI00083E903F|nr:HAD-IIB family hydrolase [Acidovorax sp. RAC01]AOG23213.1 HAD hydrolase, IIB family protein [Acidovorax sp. RAC01]